LSILVTNTELIAAVWPVNSVTRQRSWQSDASDGFHKWSSESPQQVHVNKKEGAKLNLSLFNRNMNKMMEKQLFLSGAHPESFNGGDPEAIYDLCLNLNIML
jgi:hypothetical protein